MSLDFALQVRHTPILARVEHLAQIVEIYNGTIASRQVTADLEPVSVASRQTWFDAHTPDRRPLWVVEEGGRVIAWLSFSDFYGRPAYAGTAELSVYIHENWRGHGLGQHLLNAAIAHAPRIGVDTLLGFIFSHNSPSLRLFEKFGFAVWGHLPRVAKLDAQHRDLLILGLSLQPEHGVQPA